MIMVAIAIGLNMKVEIYSKVMRFLTCFFFSSPTPSPVNVRLSLSIIFGLSSTLYHFCHPSWWHYLLTFKFDPHKNMPALQAMFVDLAVFVHTGVMIWVIRTLYQCTNLVKKIFSLVNWLQILLGVGYYCLMVSGLFCCLSRYP